MQDEPNPLSRDAAEDVSRDDHVLHVFKLEVWQQCRFALMAAEDIKDRLAAENVDVERVFQSLHAFLAAGANISKLLDGERETRERLRAEVGATEDALERMKKLRNHFEHYDERLEAWAKRDPDPNFADMNLTAPFGGISGLDASRSVLRNFEPATWVATFGDEEFDLKPALGAIEEIAVVRHLEEIRTRTETP